MSAPVLSPSLKPSELRQHILDTYLSLRIGIAVAGIVFPFLLAIGGAVYAGLPLQGSMSSYYHAAAPDGKSMRDWFVGVLFVVGFFLYLYKGFSKTENYVLNVAGVLGVGIAIFPMSQKAGGEWITLHGFCAVTFFLCIAFVCWFCADDTLLLIKSEKTQDRLRRLYRGIALAMVLSMIGAWLLLFQDSSRTFFVEAFGVIIFGIYWAAKSWELKTTSAVRRAVEGTLENRGGQVKEALAAAR